MDPFSHLHNILLYFRPLFNSPPFCAFLRLYPWIFVLSRTQDRYRPLHWQPAQEPILVINQIPVSWQMGR